MRVTGGRTHYGEAIGIITLDTAIPRFPGDPGNASTFSFPVKLRVLRGVSVAQVRRDDRTFLESLIAEAKELEKQGVRAIATGCGMCTSFQDAVAAAVRIPVFTSSLLQVPLVHRMLGRNDRVGILTSDSDSLSEERLRAAGIDSSIPVAIAGLQDQVEFSRLLRNENALDPDEIQAEVVTVAGSLVSENPDIGAFVNECANLPPYSAAIQKATALPVFDIVTLVNFVYMAVICRQFKDGFM